MSTDSSSPNDSTRFSEFLDDYFVECDEHLSIARRALLTLELQVQRAEVDRPLVDELFRSFHSLKGLSAMVGFHEAEQLAHHLEAYLGAIRQKRASLKLPGFEALIQGISTLEQIIAARRDAVPPPDVSSLVERIDRLLPVQGLPETAVPEQPQQRGASSQEDVSASIATKIGEGAQAWQVVFAPSAELVARGIDVNSVRQRLQSLGEISHSAPLIAPGGRIEFRFILISRAPHDQIMTLQGDGLTCQAYSMTPTPVPEDAIQDFATNAAEAVSTHLTPANVVRVDLQQLDELMRLVGELVLSRARLEDGLRRLDLVAPPAEVRSVRETAAAIERQLRDLREGIMRVRMVPIRQVFARMRFVVRDLVREAGKRVALRLSGEETQIDKYIVERIMDPLLHLVRNAVSHGLESPEGRAAAGKPAEGKLALRARATGETVIIEVEDDGRGIDAAAVFARARASGLEAQLRLEDATLLDVLCVPGFSTRTQSDRVSGRGIGMDVVRKSVEELGGSLALQTVAGQGTKFEIHLPLTLAITDALIVKAGPERFAVPQVAVREIIRIEPGASTMIEKNELLNYRKGVLPLLRLSRHFGAPDSVENEHYALVIGEGAQGFAIVVDRVLGLREIVVRPLTDRLVRVPGIAGATELGDGRVVLILDTANLARAIRKHGSERAGQIVEANHGR